MPMMTSAISTRTSVSIEDALRLRDEADESGEPRPRFDCDECGRAVRAHKTGTNGQAAHFEHKERNYGCSKSHRWSPAG